MQVDLYNGHKMVVVAVVQNKTAIKKLQWSDAKFSSRTKKISAKMKQTTAKQNTKANK